MRRTTLIFALAIFGCTAMQQQKAAPPKTDDLHFHNLKVLPPNIAREELLTTMRGFTRALGVKCDFCHAEKAVAEGQKAELDFPSDAKDEKRNARVMIKMTRAINTQYLPKIEDHSMDAGCWTCHRGKSKPDAPPAAPPAPATPPPH